VVAADIQVIAQHRIPVEEAEGNDLIVLEVLRRICFDVGSIVKAPRTCVPGG